MKYWIDSRSVGEQRCCGDFVNCWQLSPHRHAIIVGDVAGRGVAVGDAAVALRECARDLVISSITLTTMLCLAADVFTRTMMKESTPFVSLFVGVFDSAKRLMRYASAGHEPGLLFSADGTQEQLYPTGPVLGVEAVPSFSERALEVQSGSLLAVVTDGVTEARRSDGNRLDFFGSRGVARAVGDALRDGANPARAICRAATEHAGGVLSDDASAFVSFLQVEGNAASAACPKQIPPSLDGTSRLIQSASPSRALSSASSKRFWNTPPDATSGRSQPNVR